MLFLGSEMSDRMFAQTCPNCGGICPQQAEAWQILQIQFFKHKYVLYGRAGPPKKQPADCSDRGRYPDGIRSARHQHPLAYRCTIRHTRCTFELTVFPKESKIKSRRLFGPEQKGPHPRCHVF